ncbi:MAG: DNA gyrase C-terminal beta-propeller domain-containing protein [Kiritimatiellia bacterium]
MRGISLSEGDTVRNLEIIREDTTLMICTVNGYGKRTEWGEYRLQKRGGRGTIAIRTTERNGHVVSAHAVKDTDSLVLTTAKGMVIRTPVADTRVIGRATQGVRLINLTEGDKLVSATVLGEEGDEEKPETGEQPSPAGQ